MGIRCNQVVQPEAVLYCRLEGKDNAILNFEMEKEVFLTLGSHKIAVHCYYYDKTCRIESFYKCHTLRADELFKPENLRQIARQVLEQEIDTFPSNERRMCEQLRDIYSPETLAKVKHCLPEGDLTFCHDDTYHGNIMKLDSGGD